ncbi:hypothetical protein D9M71_351830 [compost metagenome]
MVGNGLGLDVRRQHSGGRVSLVGDHDGDDFFRWNRDGGAANAIVDLDQRNRCTGRTVGRNVDVVQTFEIRVVRHVDFDDHVLGENREAGRVADRGGWHDMPLLGDRNGFNHGNVRQFQLLVAQLLHGFRQVLVDEHDFAGIDRLAQSAVDLKRHASRQHASFGQLLVEVVAQACAGHQADLERRDLGTLGQRLGDGLGFTCASKATHADGHAVLNQSGSVGSAHHFVQQRRQANTVTVHGLLSRATGSRTCSLVNCAGFCPATKVAIEASIPGLSSKTPLPDR